MENSDPKPFMRLGIEYVCVWVEVGGGGSSYTIPCLVQPSCVGARTLVEVSLVAAMV